jgi:hypothetical protein
MAKLSEDIQAALDTLVSTRVGPNVATLTNWITRAGMLQYAVRDQDVLDAAFLEACPQCNEPFVRRILVAGAFEYGDPPALIPTRSVVWVCENECITLGDQAFRWSLEEPEAVREAASREARLNNLVSQLEAESPSDLLSQGFTVNLHMDERGAVKGGISRLVPDKIAIRVEGTKRTVGEALGNLRAQLARLRGGK